MRKNIFSLMLGAVVALASCSQEEVLNNDSVEKSVTFFLKTEQAVTRATATVSRYVVAVYNADGTAEVMPEQEFTTSTISINVNPGTYTFLFWADNGNTEYNAADLKDIQVTNDATNEEAFFCQKEFHSNHRCE